MFLLSSSRTIMLTEQTKAELKAYKYSCIDTSPLSKYVMHPFWNWVTQFYPRWLAPNLITFGGFLLTVAHFLLLSYFNPHFDHGSAVPSWAWLATAILVFVAHTLDGTDGKQARRTKSSSPLGELFDHGCDSWAVYFLPASLYTLCGVYSSPFRLFWIQWSLIFSFISSHWEKYITGVLYLPWTFDIAQLAVASMCLAAYRWSVNTCSIFTIFGYSFVGVLEFLLHSELDTRIDLLPEYVLIQDQLEYYH
ncbi:Choline/ethanolaminephosphotransferase [Fasciola gigantica]|uniref:Choline/ethanolaminephosphotransferase n=1 Tax=Fasciola gigantica TaxID=46835 RepID=A0A504YWN6_FASGI|nr:Choline/ethanolaminephosphotransferase [Fasciola gigantica]